MKPHEQLRSNVRVLTAEHTRIYEHEQLLEGGTVPGLIQQVRTAITVSGDRAGGGGKPVPMNMPAFSLLDRISRELVTEMLAWHVAPAKVRDRIMIEGGLWAWSKLMATGEDHTARALDITRGWITSIEALFEPIRETELIGPCPACGYEKCTKEIDGDECVVSTLVAVGATVTCQYCTASWAGEQLHYLHAALAATPQEDNTGNTPAKALA